MNNRPWINETTVTIGYARVSSTDNRQQLGLEVQTDALAFCDRLFVERESGACEERTQLLQALKLAKKLCKQGRQVSLVVYRLDRLSRRMFALVEMMKDLADQGIQLVSLKEQIDTQSLTGQLLVVLLGYVAEMELEAIRMRTKDGLRKAKERGAKLGNPGLSKEVEQAVISLYTQS